MLDAQGMPVGRCAEDVGCADGVVRGFYDDERLLPDFDFLGDLWQAYPGTDPSGALYFEPESPQATARDMLAGPEGGGPLQITVCGCGNLGHVLTGLCSARPDLRVNVLVSTPEKASKIEQGMTAHDGILVRFRDRDVVGHPRTVTADPALAISGSRLILLALPSFAEAPVLERIAPFLEDDAIVGSIPAPGGFDWKARDVLRRFEKKNPVFGLGTIPWMCKVQEYGAVVKVLGTKYQNGLVALPAERTGEILDLMSLLLGVPVVDLRNFLNLTFIPGNQLLHPGIMYDLFSDWDGKPLAESPLFYEDVSESAARLLSEMNDETIALRFDLESRVPGLRLTGGGHLVQTIVLSYKDDVLDRRDLRAMIASNLSYAGIRTPMVEVDGGLAPDYSSRFFWEDVPHGLVVLKAMAEMAEVPTPQIDRVLTWCQEKMGREYLVDGKLRGKDLAETGAPQSYGIERPEDLIFDRW